MSNIHYAVLIIGALSLLLGLSIGQIHRQHQRIEQLEFNRFRQSGGPFQLHKCPNACCNTDHFRDAYEMLERSRRLQREERRRKTEQAEEAEKRLEEAVRRYNKELQRWEDEWRGTKRGLIRIEK